MTKTLDDLETKNLRKRVTRRSLVMVSLLVGPPLVVALLLFLVLTAFSVPIVEQELRRVTSPDGRTDAVLMYYGGGGAAGWTTRGIYLTPAGAEAEEGELVLDHPHLGTGTRISWRDGRPLEIGTEVEGPRQESVVLGDALGDEHEARVEAGPPR